MRQEAVVEFLYCGAERWAFCVRDKVVDGEVVASWLQPIEQGLHVHVPLRRLDSAKERVLKDPLELPWRWFPQEIGLVEFRPQTDGRGFAGQTDSTWGKVESAGLEPAAGPRPDIVPRTATGDTYGAACKLRMCLQEVYQTG